MDAPEGKHSRSPHKPKGCKLGVAREGSSQVQGDDNGSQGKVKRKRCKNEAPAGGKKKGKPGKRQREALKAAAAAGRIGGGAADT